MGYDRISVLRGNKGSSPRSLLPNFFTFSRRCKGARKKNLKFFKKPLDKQLNMCYNIRAVRTGTH
jgi:hypothetical protein